MEAIIKTIIFAVCFPLGMSLIYGVRRKIKGAKIVSDSNFVKVSEKNAYSSPLLIFYYFL